MVSGVLADVIMRLEDLGLTDVLLPFLLIFTIIFAIFQKSKILGTDKQNFNVIIALIISLLVVIPHVTDSYPVNADPIQIINQSIPNVAVVIVAILMVLMLMGVFGVEFTWAGRVTGGIVIIALIIVIAIFGKAAAWWGEGVSLPWWLNWLEDPNTQTLVVVLIVFGIIIWFITRSGERSQGTGLLEEFGKLFSRK
ncbi:MAG: hypothetical protein Q7J54_00715 [Candidatus Woesearchaeota archaeon]|nr:hypothetical protein [Candidatus Woesearchaeota archaeon]